MEKIITIISAGLIPEIFAYSLILIGILVLAIYAFKKNDNFIYVSDIIKDHFKIFKEANKHILVLYVTPILLASGISILYDISDNFKENLMVISTVIISSLLAFQGSIMNIKIDKSDNQRKEMLIKETNANIVFLVFINIILIFLLLIDVEIKCLNILMEIIIIYILLITFLTTLVILKRIRNLFK